MDRQRFVALWRRCVEEGPAPDGGAVFDELFALYSEPHRRYHTPGHVVHCLRHFDLASDRMDDPDAVEMSIWFHDAIYDPDADDNERRSAELFVELADGGASEAFRRAVYDLIMVTVHRERPTTLDQGFMVDIDLSSFGLPWEEMLRDSVAVREEFSHIPDEEFFPKQRRFLEALVAREPFCFTEFFQRRHGETARANIERYLARIERDGGL